MERRKEYREKTGKRNPRPMRATETFYQDSRGVPPMSSDVPIAESGSTNISLISLMTLIDFTTLPSTEQCKADLDSYPFKEVSCEFLPVGQTFYPSLSSSSIFSICPSDHNRHRIVPFSVPKVSLVPSDHSSEHNHTHTHTRAQHAP